MAVLASAPGPVALGPAPVRVVLAVSSADRAALVRAAGAGKALLRLSHLSARAQPGVVWRVYVGLPEDTEPDEARGVGTVNFFNVVALAGGRPKADQPLDFAIGRQLGNLTGEEGVAVTFVAEGAPAPGSDATIGRIEIGQIQ